MRDEVRPPESNDPRLAELHAKYCAIPAAVGGARWPRTTTALLASQLNET